MNKKSLDKQRNKTRVNISVAFQRPPRPQPLLPRTLVARHGLLHDLLCFALKLFLFYKRTFYKPTFCACAPACTFPVTTQQSKEDALKTVMLFSSFITRTEKVWVAEEFVTVSAVQPHQSFVISKSVLFLFLFLCAEGPLCLGETVFVREELFSKTP